MTFRDHFSRQAALYSAYRPSYPPELFDFIAGLAAHHERAWDCATGSGQAAVPLSKYFSDVIATDASAEQIAHGKQRDNVRYAVARAGASGIDSGSVDLVTVAQALHWLDLEEFYSEAKRVLKPRGAIAVWGYGDPVMDDPQLQSIVHSFNRGTLEHYWAGNRDLLLDGYRTLPFPFREVAAPELRLQKNWSLDDLAGYFRTWSATNRFAAEQGYDPVIEVETELARNWGESESKRLVVWPLFLRVGYRD